MLNNTILLRQLRTVGISAKITCSRNNYHQFSEHRVVTELVGLNSELFVFAKDAILLLGFCSWMPLNGIIS